MMNEMYKEALKMFRMRIVYLEGVLMDNNEFISDGKKILLNEKQLKNYVKEKTELKKQE